MTLFYRYRLAQTYRQLLVIITKTANELFKDINIGDLKRPRTPKQGVLVFFAIFRLRRTLQE